MKFHRYKGFSLVEVMIALVVVAVGLLALSRYHIELFQASGDAGRRTVAAQIAEQTMDDLRGFSNIGADSDGDGNADLSEHVYDLIIGGVDVDGKTTTVPSGHTLSASIYSAAAITTVAERDFLFPIQTEYYLRWWVAGDSPSNAKNITVEVMWLDEKGDEKTVELTASIAEYNPAVLALFSTGGPGLDAGIDRNTQKKTLKGVAPDVIPFEFAEDPDLGVHGRQASKPTIDISKKDASVETAFEVVNYFKKDGETQVDAYVIESFATKNCQCDMQLATTTPQYYTPSRTVWFDNTDAVNGEGLLGGRTGIIKNKQYGTSNASGVFLEQDASGLCTICCGNHIDAGIIESDVYIIGTPDPVPICKASDKKGCYDPERTVFDHKHYEGTATTVTSGTYYEACRLKKIGQSYKVMQDWKLIAFNIIPDSYFNDGGATAIKEYNDYVTCIVKDDIDDTYLN